ncbi:MAG: hypothetical protein ACLSEX_04505 [Blautia sp.]
MECDHTVIFACSSLESYVKEAQRKMHTSYPVVYLDKKNHSEPQNMRQCIVDAEGELRSR